jgi:hypothetical protein
MDGSRSCSITLTAHGGPVSWSVTGTSGNVTVSSNSGNIGGGQTVSVGVTRHDSICLGSGSGSVSFSSGGTASVTWKC